MGSPSLNLNIARFRHHSIIWPRFLPHRFPLTPPKSHPNNLSYWVMRRPSNQNTQAPSILSQIPVHALSFQPLSLFFPESAAYPSLLHWPKPIKALLKLISNIFFSLFFCVFIWLLSFLNIKEIWELIGIFLLYHFETTQKVLQ